MEANLVQRAGYRFTGIPSAGLHGVGIKALPGNILRLFKGLQAARRIIKEFHPDGLLLTGGYVSIPVAIAGRKTPNLLFVPDIEPGLAIKLVSRFASKIAVTTADSLRFFNQKSKVIVTGYPTRSELIEREQIEVRKKFNLTQDKRVVMVLGGSQGAQSMNRALYPQLPELLKRFQIIHLYGEQNREENQAESNKLPGEESSSYHPYPFLHAEDLSAAFSASDLVVSRAGAAVLGEFPLFGLPAILVPYPYAWRYQQVNADYLENHGAAIVLQDADMRSSLTNILFDLFDHPERLLKMANAMNSLSNPSAAQYIARQIEEIVQESAMTPKGRLI